MNLELGLRLRLRLRLLGTLGLGVRVEDGVEVGIEVVVCT